MGTLLAKNADVVVTMDGQRRELRNAGLFARDGMIEKVGPTAELPESADLVLDLRGHILLPGLINCHHHLDQILTRNLPAGQNTNLFPWLQAHYRVWASRTPEDTRTAVLVGCAELARSGCTTVFDHAYVFKNGCKVDDQIAAAAELGIRFAVSRGSMSLGQSKGGLPPDDCVEDENAILKDSVRVIERYHDSAPGSMLQIVLAPCSPFSVTAELMRESAKMARHYGVKLHTHLCETLDEERYTLQHLGTAPGRLYGVARLGGTGRLVRPRRARQRRGDPPVREQGRRRLPLPVVEHAARVRDRAGEEISRRRRADRARSRRLRQQRRIEPPDRGARGDAAGAAEDRPAAARGARRPCCRPPIRCGPRSG